VNSALLCLRNDIRLMQRQNRENEEASLMTALGRMLRYFRGKIVVLERWTDEFLDTKDFKQQHTEALRIRETTE